MESTIRTELFTSFDRLTSMQSGQVAQFLFTHLEQYGDQLEDIKKCLAYAMKEVASPGGFVVVAREGEEMVGVVVINKTGMEGYIPENILVYIAVHGGHRGKGIGKTLMEKALSTADGDVALHVEPNNPAKRLYERLGFENKYLEMRYKKSK